MDSRPVVRHRARAGTQGLRLHVDCMFPGAAKLGGPLRRLYRDWKARWSRLRARPSASSWWERSQTSAAFRSLPPGDRAPAILANLPHPFRSGRRRPPATPSGPQAEQQRKRRGKPRGTLLRRADGSTTAARVIRGAATRDSGFPCSEARDAASASANREARVAATRGRLPANASASQQSASGACCESPNPHGCPTRSGRATGGESSTGGRRTAGDDQAACARSAARTEGPAGCWYPTRGDQAACAQSAARTESAAGCRYPARGR